MSLERPLFRSTMIEVVLICLATLLVILWWRSRPKNLPPSPGMALPVVGHLHKFKPDLMETIYGWREELGDIYSLKMGFNNVVMLNGYSLISEALLKHHESLLARPNNFSHEELFNYGGIISLSGERWKEQRAFLTSTLRSLGFGRNIMAERIRIETDYLLADMADAKGEPRDVSMLMITAVTNIICGVMFTKRFDYQDKSILYWLRFVKRLFEVLGASAVLNFFSFLKYAPGDVFNYKEVKTIVVEMKSTLTDWMNKDNRPVNVSQEIFEDLTQAYLTEIERKKLEGITDTTLDEENFLSTTYGLFNSGGETTSNTIVFTILYLINFPEMQERLYQEIKENVGTDKVPEMTDKPKLKFLNAFIMETQRYGGVVPIGIDRVATKDIQLGGYSIPAGTTVMFNLDSALSDTAAWGDPQNFRPGRFLDDEDNLKVPKEFIPFGVGKRNCIGESLANMELFLFISALIQKFEFRAEDEDAFPTMVPNIGFTRSANPFKVRSILRAV